MAVREVVGSIIKENKRYTAADREWDIYKWRYAKPILIAAGISYVVLLAFTALQFLPSPAEINEWRSGRYWYYWFISVCAFGGLFFFYLKRNWLTIFGLTEIAVAIASAHALQGHSFDYSPSYLVASAAVIYLFAKGFENSSNGVAKLIVTINQRKKKSSL